MIGIDEFKQLVNGNDDETVLNELKKRRFVPNNTEYCKYAAVHGHLVTLKWLRENGCPWVELTCSKAAEYGRLETLKWLRENGCPWDVQTCASAVMYGHIEVLKWAHNNGCPCSGYCRKYIVKYNGTYVSHQQRKIAIATLKLRSYAKALSRLVRVFRDFMEERYAPPGVYMEEGGAGYADGLCRWCSVEENSFFSNESDDGRSANPKP